MTKAGYLYPKSKSPSELKYERLRGMCDGAWGDVRYIPIDNGIQIAWCAWRYMVGVVCISVYWLHGGRGAGQCTGGRAGPAAGQQGIPAGQGRRQGVCLCTICEHSIQPPSPELRNARVRVSRARACVRYIIILLYYYYIIILLYLYIPNIYSIPSYTQQW